MRSISFLAVPAFQIASERALERRLRDRPLAVVASGNGRSRLIEVSTEARRRGIRRGMPANDAKRNCRDLELLMPNPDVCARANQAIQKVVDQFTPVSQSVRPGQFYLDLTGLKRLFGGSLAVTEAILGRCERELKLPAEAGIAINKLVSRVAALDAAPDGLLSVEGGGEEPFLAPKTPVVLPVVDLKVKQRLIELNVRSIGQIRQINIDHLVAGFGSAGYLLGQQARGIDSDPVLPPTIQLFIRAEKILPEDSNDREVIDALIKSLVVEAAIKLKREKSCTGELELIIAYSDGIIGGASYRFKQPASEYKDIESALGVLAGQVITRRIRVRRVEVCLRKLTTQSVQGALWAGESAQESDAIIDAIDKIKSRFGDAALRWGV